MSSVDWVKPSSRLATAIIVLLTHGAAAAERLPSSGCFENGCHAEKAKVVAATKIPHEPLPTRGCEACHLSHGNSTPPALLTQAVPGLCFSCHREFEKRILGARHLHAPVRAGRCTGCHDPHGTDYVHLLKKWWLLSPDWDPYGIMQYVLFCSECHGKDLYKAEETDAATAFRDGTSNLHAIHVLRKKGRSCISCHEVHAADQPFQIRANVPFGVTWTLPLSFTRTGNGGRCVVGCHRERQYSRSP